MGHTIGALDKGEVPHLAGREMGQAFRYIGECERLKSCSEG